MENGVVPCPGSSRGAAVFSLAKRIFPYPDHSPTRSRERAIGHKPNRAAPARLALGLSLILVSPNLCARSNEPLKRYEFSLPRMGTIFRIGLYSPHDSVASRAAEAAFARAEELEQIMSDYRADSELMRLSREGAIAPFPVSGDLYDVLAKSLWVSELSGGVFDVSVGPLVDLWRSARKTGRLPDPGEITKAKALVDYRNIELDPVRHTVFLKRAGMKLDLGAIGKGYAADQMLAVLQSQGIHHAMVEAGGEVVVGEPPPGNSGWKVGIDTAADAGSVPCTLLLHAAAVSTSGDEHQFLEFNGHRYSHVTNPATGWALEGESSTTVMARDSTTADALGTAFSLMSVADGIRVAESLPGVSALWVRRVGGEWMYYSSRGFPTSCRELRERGK
jgi:thiamine biosynthesis lipoprotein